MNIALIIFRAEIERGGAERYLHELAFALAQRGHRVTMLASSGSPPDGVEFVRINSGGLSRTAKYQRFCRNVEHHLQANTYDIVHSVMPVPRCDVYHPQSGLELLALREGHLLKPTLTRQAAAKFLNQFNRKRQAFARVESALLHSASRPFVIFLSNREREEAAVLFPTVKDRFVTIYDMPNDARFEVADVAALRKRMRKQLSLDDAQTMFLFIGNDFARKGLATAIRAIGKLSDPRAMLFVVGEGDTERYTELALKAGAMGRILFVGRTDDVRSYLAAADATVLPTRWEPFGMVVVESMLMGVPPIVSRVAGSSEVVQHGHDGFVIESPTDVDAWAQAMTEVTDRPFRNRLAKACLEQRERFSYARHVDAIEAIYRQCKSRNNP